MANPAQVQADVNLRTLRTRDVSQPVEMRGGQVRSITLNIPLLTAPNAYLVVRLPDSVVSGLLTHVRTLPEQQRADFLREWVMRNQEAVLDQYVRSGASSRRFRYNVVPVQSITLADITPRRVEPPAQPAPRPVAPNPLASAPPGQRPGRVIQPGGQPPPATARREETRQPARPPVPPAPEVRERPVAAPPTPARVELPPMPREITGGNGSTANPYTVYRTARDAERIRRTRSETLVDGSFRVQIEGFGELVFRVFLSEAQMEPSVRGRTRQELWRIFQAVFQRAAAEHPERTLDNTAMRTAGRDFTGGFTRFCAQYDQATRSE